MPYVMDDASQTIQWLQERIEQLENALNEYGQHCTCCRLHPENIYPHEDDPDVCTCGLDIVRKGE